MEGGYYNISLDNLFRILGVMGADIGEVWPAETTAADETNPIQLRRIQEFRISEIINLSEAEGAALFSVQGDRSTVLLQQNLSDFLLDRPASTSRTGGSTTRDCGSGRSWVIPLLSFS
jgi:hypothetical protein